jgi:hypothetical protein
MDTSHRRDFVRRLALGATVSAVAAPGPALADGPARSEADARMEVVLARFGRHLDDDARKAVRDEIEGHIRRAATLRRFPLTNGDAPAPVFVPYRAD